MEQETRAQNNEIDFFYGLFLTAASIGIAWLGYEMFMGQAVVPIGDELLLILLGGFPFFTAYYTLYR